MKYAEEKYKSYSGGIGAVLGHKPWQYKRLGGEYPHQYYWCYGKQS